MRAETSATLPCLDLGFTRLANLRRQTRTIPVNPALRYIDAWIYVDNRHHPIAITELRFGRIADDTLPVSAVCRSVMKCEGLSQYRDTEWHFDIALPIAECARVLSGAAANRDSRLKAERQARKVAHAAKKRHN